MAGPSYDTGAVLNQVQYADAQPLIPWEIRDEIFRMLPEASIAMKRFRKAPNMVGRETSQPVLSMLPEAFFVTGDEGYRQTSKMAWDRVQFFAEVLSVIVPIPITVVRDSRYPMWPQIQPELVAAIGRAFDKAVLWGTNSPATWPTNLYAQAASKGKVILQGQNGDMYADLLEPGGLHDAVESGGYDPSEVVCGRGMRAQLRGARDADGQPLLMRTMTQPAEYEVDGMTYNFYKGSVMNPTYANMICGDWSQALWTLREDIEITFATEGVISDPNTGQVLINLKQQKVVAMYVDLRCAWALPLPVIEGIPASQQFPFSFFKAQSQNTL